MRNFLFTLFLHLSHHELLLDSSFFIFKLPFFRNKSVFCFFFFLTLFDFVLDLTCSVFSFAEAHEFEDSLGGFLFHVGDGFVLETGVVIVLCNFLTLLKVVFEAFDVDFSLFVLVGEGDVECLFELF